MTNNNFFSKRLSSVMCVISTMTREWFGNDSVYSRLSLGSNLSRISLASLICLCMLTVGSGNAWGASASATFKSSGSYSTTITTAGSTITVVASSSDLAGWNSGAPGWSCGSATNTFSFTISTLSTKYITSVSVTAKRTKSKTITASVTVGGNDYGGDAQISEASTSYNTFEFEDAVGVTGNIVITLTSPGGSQKADKGTLMLSDITIEYEDSPVTPSCANKVTLTKGSTTNGTFDLDKANGEHDNCDANFVVHVSNIVPADGSKYCNGIEVTGGNSTVTGPVEGVWTVTYTKDNDITSTITPTYATKTSYTVTWYNDGVSIATESVYSGDKVSALPSPAPTSSCSGEFIGWTTSADPVWDKNVTDNYTTLPTVFTTQAGSPTITGNTAFHAVYRMPKPD